MIRPFDLTPRRLGPTPLQVPALCVGTAPLGDMPDAFGFSPGEDRALATLRAAFAGPVHFIDTAAAYGDGTAERRIGQVLREIGPLAVDWVIATKADRDLATGEFQLAIR